MRPDVVVVLVVARTHINHFPTLEHTAAEKASLLDRLPPSGLAILNGEDPRVLAMADRCRCRVVTFGRSPRFDFWASEVSARWPSRLTFRIHTATQSQWVKTNLVGEHWLSSVLGALEQVQPYRARLQPLALPCGATLLRDDENGSVTALQEALGVMKEAEVPRRIAVLGDTWDSGLGEPRARLEDLGRRVAGTVDLAVFVGEYGHYAAEALIASGMKPEKVRSIPGLRETAEFLKSELRPGDLALLKGQYMQHLSRIYLAQLGPVQCWKMKCLEITPCERCEELS
jgi:UDP-N-acetylmuramoyl-tripeptide--D-alanyl-D-alanine ligase